MTTTARAFPPPPARSGGGGKALRRCGGGSGARSTNGGSPTRCCPRLRRDGGARPLPARAWRLLSFTNADQFNLGGKDLPSSYTWIGLENYRTIFESAEFKSVGWFTVVWTFVNVFFHVTVGLILAIVLNRTLRLRGMYRLLLLIPWAVPSFISAFTFRFLFNSPYGFFAQILQKLGMDPEQVPAFLSDPFWAKVVVITANVWAGIRS